MKFLSSCVTSPSFLLVALLLSIRDGTSVDAYKARRILQGNSTSTTESNGGSSNFIVSQASHSSTQLCLAAVEGTMRAGNLGLQLCDFANAPPAQLWSLPSTSSSSGGGGGGGNVASNLGNGMEYCMMINHGNNIFDGVRARLGSCSNSQTDFTFDGEYLKVSTGNDGTEYCITPRGVNANLADTILAKRCIDRADFKWTITGNAPTFTTDSGTGTRYQLYDTDSMGCVQPEKTTGTPNIGTDVIIDDCDNSRAWFVDIVNGAVVFSSAVDTNMCIQAGYGGAVVDGTKMRLRPCDTTNPLQRFLWDDFEAPIKLEQRSDLCMVEQGTNPKIGEHLIMKNCNARMDEWSGDELS